MKEVINNIEVELSGSIVYINNLNGDLLRAIDVNPNSAVTDYKNLVIRLKKANKHYI